MYDWANSAYATTVMVGLLPAYFAEVVVGEGGVQIGGTTYAADTLWAFTVGCATLIAFISAPVLGAIADFSAARKRFLLTFAYTGSLFALLLWFVHSGDVFRTLVFFTIVVAPLCQIALLLWVLVPLRWDRVPWQLPHAFRLLRHVQPWSMMEVFIIGILVAIVKLMGMATIVPGLALWSFVLLMLTLAGAVSSFEPEAVWERLERLT